MSDVAGPSILQTYASVADLDPWVLSAIGDLTNAAIEQGFWDPSNLEQTLHPPVPNRAHPVWDIVMDKRATMTDEEAIRTRPIWLVADDGLPCVRWVSNIPLAFSCSAAAPSSSVTSEINSDDFEDEESRGRGHTPRSQPATGVSRAQEEDDKQDKPEADQNTEDDESGAKSDSAIEGEGEDSKKVEICK